MTEYLYIKIEAITGRNEIGMFHFEIPFGEELEHEVDDIMEKLQGLDFPYKDRMIYRISYATTVKGLITSAGIIYAKLVTTVGEPDNMEDWIDGDVDEDRFIWDVIVCKDCNEDFQMF